MEAREIAERLRTVAELAGIVQAMRTLASTRLRQAQERFGGLERYARATRDVLGEALALAPSVPPVEAAPRRRLVVLLSEHGFVGALDARLVERASELARETGAELVGLGTRGLRVCRERGLVVRAGGAMPATASASATAVERIVAVALDDGPAAEVTLLFARHVAPLAWEPATLRLLPAGVEAKATLGGGEPALHTLDVADLVARAVGEYVYAQVAWAVAEAFASENAARLAAMDAARRHVDERLAELRELERRVWQEAVTHELLEVVAGAELAREEAS